MKRPVKILIALSVLLNLLLIGVIAGHLSRQQLGGPRMPLMAIADKLPEAKRAQVKATLRRSEAKVADIRRASDEARRRAGELLKAEPFDKAAYVAQLHRMNTLRSEMMDQMGRSIAEVAEDLNAEERATLADALAKMGPRRGGPKPSERQP